MPDKVILCYGDSNTHGTKPLVRPGELARFGDTERWPALLQRRLTSVRVVEEGLPGRTTVHDDPIEGRHKNGLAYLRPCLESQLPVDVLVLMLGTNDLKARFSVTPTDIAASIGVLLQEIRACRAGPAGGTPDVLVLAPVPIQEVGLVGGIFAGGADKSRRLAPLYREVAAGFGRRCLDAGSVAAVSPTDGIHYEADQHERLARLVGDALAGSR